MDIHGWRSGCYSLDELFRVVIDRYGCYEWSSCITMRGVSVRAAIIAFKRLRGGKDESGVSDVTLAFGFLSVGCGLGLWMGPRAESIV